MKRALVILFAWSLFAAGPAPLPAEKALKIANLESKRNALAAEFQATVLQAERLQKAVQDADAAYRTAVEAEKKAAGVDPACTLVENQTWKCPEKPELKKGAAPPLSSICRTWSRLRTSSTLRRST